MDRINELENLITKHRYLYYNGTPEISDDEFDALEDELRLLDPASSVLTQVGAPVGHGKKVKLPVEMGSLEKELNPKGLISWEENKLKTLQRNQGLTYTVSEKIDGSSLLLIYERGTFVRALTRGQGNEGEDVTHNAVRIPFPKSLPVPYTGEIRAEVYLKTSVFDKYFSETKNARNTASGLIRSKDGAAEHLSIFAYHIYRGDFDTEVDIFRTLESWGFATPFIGVGSLDWVLTAYSEYVDHIRSELDHLIDGLVITIDDRSTHEELGSLNMRPKYSVAFKFPPTVVLAEIIGFTWEVSEGAKFVPVAQLNPTPMSGITLRNVSMHNLEYLANTRAVIGSTIKVERSGDVIPHYVGTVKDGPHVKRSDVKFDPHLAWGMPRVCPVCSTALKVVGVFLTCPNLGCLSRVIGDIKKYVSLHGILHVGDTTIEELSRMGILKDAADLYTLSLEDFTRVERKGEKHYVKMMVELEKSKEQKLPMFLAGLNIPDIQDKSWEKVIQDNKVTTVEEVFDLTLEQLRDTSGIGDKKAVSIYEGIRQKKPLLDKLLSVGVSVKGKKSGSLSGKSFCFTGTFMRAKRKDMEDLVEDLGGSVASVTKNLDYLVQSDPNSTSSKSEKAKKLGVPIISEETFWDMVE